MAGGKALETMMVTSRAQHRPREGSSGIAKRAFGVSRKRRAPRVQAGGVRRARRAGRARSRAGHDAAARREVRRPAADGAADALSPDHAERDPRLLPPAEGPLALDDAPFLALARPRRG